jgi:hypothetical protein
VTVVGQNSKQKSYVNILSAFYVNFVLFRSERYDQYGFEQSSFDGDDVQSVMQNLAYKSEQLLHTVRSVHLSAF